MQNQGTPNYLIEICDELTVMVNIMKKNSLGNIPNILISCYSCTWHMYKVFEKYKIVVDFCLESDGIFVTMGARTKCDKSDISGYII